MTWVPWPIKSTWVVLPALLLLLDFWPSPRHSVISGLNFDLPIPSLGDLGGLAPELSGLTLTLDQTQTLRHRRGVLVMEAQMTGTLP